MFRNLYQNGLLSIFYSCGSDPLAIWETEVNNGHIKRLTDDEVNSIVLEIVSTNVTTTYMSCPRDKKTLGIKLPFLVMIIKNLKRYFTFEITILDDKNMRRRFRISNFQSTTKILPFCTSMPIGLAEGWNQIQFNLADFTKRAYGTQFMETLRVQIHANCRLRRIYFCEKLFTEEELPQDYKLYLPLERKQKKEKAKETKQEDLKVAKSVEAVPVAQKKSATIATPTSVEGKEPKDVEVDQKVSVASGQISATEDEVPTQDQEGQKGQEAESGAPDKVASGEKVTSGKKEGEIDDKIEGKPKKEQTGKEEDHDAQKSRESAAGHESAKSRESVSVHESKKSRESVSVHESKKSRESVSVHESKKSRESVAGHESKKSRESVAGHESAKSRESSVAVGKSKTDTTKDK